MPVAGSAVLWVRASEPEEGGELLLRSCRARWLRPGLQARAVWSWVSQGVEKGRPKLTWALIGTPVSHSWRMEEQKYISFQVMLANCHTTCRWVSQPCCASVWLNILQHTHTHTHTHIHRPFTWLSIRYENVAFKHIRTRKNKIPAAETVRLRNSLRFTMGGDVPSSTSQNMMGSLLGRDPSSLQLLMEICSVVFFMYSCWQTNQQTNTHDFLGGDCSIPWLWPGQLQGVVQLMRLCWWQNMKLD